MRTIGPATIVAGLLGMCACDGTTDAPPLGEETDAIITSPTVGGPVSQLPTYVCTTQPGTFCKAPPDGPGPLTTVAEVTPYLDNAARNWGCFYGNRSVTALPGGLGFRKVYVTLPPHMLGREYCAAYWNATTQAAYVVLLAAAPSAHTATNIATTYDATGGPAGTLGMPVSNPVPYGWANATYQLFTNGLITSSPAYGAHFVGGDPGSAPDDYQLAVAFEHAFLVSPSAAGSPTLYPLMTEAKNANDSLNQKLGRYAPFWDPSGSQGLVLLRSGQPGHVIVGVIATEWNRFTGSSGNYDYPNQIGSAWNASMGFPTSDLAVYDTTPAGFPLSTQSFEHGRIDWVTDCASTAGVYAAHAHAQGNNPIVPQGLMHCNVVDTPCQSTEATPTPLSGFSSFEGSFFWKCPDRPNAHGTVGKWDGITLTWHETDKPQQTRTIDGDIFQTWTGGMTGDTEVSSAVAQIEVAMIGIPKPWGLPRGDVVCRDELCTQMDQTFDKAFVLADHGVVSFTRDDRGTIRYNHVRAKSYHNSFTHDETLWEILTYYRVRSIELDFHAHKGSFPDQSNDDPNGADWFVYHYEGPTTDNDSRCLHLSDCHDVLMDWHRQNPNHEVITVFGDAGAHTSIGVDVVENPAWDDGHTPLDFDRRITADLAGTAPDGKPILFKPGDLLAWCNAKPYHNLVYTLREAVATCGWPTLKELRGHMIWVITNDTGDLGYGTRSYIDFLRNGNRLPSQEAAFVISESPNLTDDIVYYNFGFCDTDSQCYDHVTQANRNDVVWAYDHGYVTRLYSNDDTSTWAFAKRPIPTYTGYAPTNFPATHHGADNQNFLTTPVGGRGYPFECIDAAGAYLVDGVHCDTTSWVEDSAPVLRLVAQSVGSNLGANYLARVKNDPMNAQTATRFVWTTGVIGDHTDHGGVAGCLMARLNNTSTSPYFAVCRDNRGQDDGSINHSFVEWRLPGGPVQTRMLNIDPLYGLEMQHGVFLKMSVYRDATGHTFAVGYASRNGTDWGCANGSCDYSVDFGLLGAPLKWQGVAMTGANAIHEFYFQDTRVRAYRDARGMADDPNDGSVLISDRNVRAYDLPAIFGTGAQGDFGEGLGGGYGQP